MFGVGWFADFTRVVYPQPASLSTHYFSTLLTPRGEGGMLVGMKVLIGCEESGTVTQAFRDRGHEAYSCDLLPTRGNPDWHIQGDVLEEAYSGKYQLMIAHPPCTYLSKAGARWMYPKAGEMCPRRYALAVDAKNFFMKLLDAPVARIAVENPTPLRVAKLPQHSQVIQPYEYGHPHSKRTLLWLQNLPRLTPTKCVHEWSPFLPSNTGGKKRGQAYCAGSAKNARDASKTFQGIAEAMADQWGSL